MKENTPEHVLCVEAPAGAGSQVLPAPAVIVVVVVLLITAGLVAFGMAMELVIAAVVVGGLMGKELVRSLVTIFSPRRAR